MCIILLLSCNVTPKTLRKNPLKLQRITNFCKKREGKYVSFILVAYYMHERNFDYPVPLVEVGFLKNLWWLIRRLWNGKWKYTSSSLYLSENLLFLEDSTQRSHNICAIYILVNVEPKGTRKNYCTCWLLYHTK